MADATPSPTLLDFTFLLVSAGDFAMFNKTHSIVGRSYGFSRLSLDWSGFPPVQITLREAILVLVRNVDAPTCRTTANT